MMFELVKDRLRFQLSSAVSEKPLCNSCKYNKIQSFASASFQHRAIPMFF